MQELYFIQVSNKATVLKENISGSQTKETKQPGSVYAKRFEFKEGLS